MFVQDSKSMFNLCLSDCLSCKQDVRRPRRATILSHSPTPCQSWLVWLTDFNRLNEWLSWYGGRRIHVIRCTQGHAWCMALSGPLRSPRSAWVTLGCADRGDDFSVLRVFRDRGPGYKVDTEGVTSYVVWSLVHFVLNKLRNFRSGKWLLCVSFQILSEKCIESNVSPQMNLHATGIERSKMANPF